jgi:hypothetical protein
MSVRSIIVLLIVSLPLFNFCSAQDTNPESLAKEYFKVMAEDGMTSVARFMHPEALESFKSMVLPVFEFEAESGDRQLMDLTFGTTMHIAKLKNTDSESFMNGFMNIIAAQLGSTKLSFDKLEILGTISEGSDRHVLTRMTIGVGELSLTQFEVLSFKPYEGSWRLQLNGKMKGIANTLRSSITKE